MTKLRWGADAPNDTSAARERLIDAAEACFHRYGVMKTTVEDVAATARVSRATVYRYFDGRDAIILAVLLREGSRFLDRLRDKLAAQPDLETALVTGVLYTVKAVRADENLALLFAPEAAGVTGSVAGASEALFELTAEFLHPLLEAAQESEQLRTGIEVQEAAEWTLRTILSLLTVAGPRHRTEADQYRFLQTYLVPSLVANPSPPEPRRTSRQRKPAASRR